MFKIQGNTSEIIGELTTSEWQELQQFRTIATSYTPSCSSSDFLETDRSDNVPTSFKGSDSEEEIFHDAVLSELEIVTMTKPRTPKAKFGPNKQHIYVQMGMAGLRLTVKGNSSVTLSTGETKLEVLIEEAHKRLT